MPDNFKGTLNIQSQAWRSYQIGHEATVIEYKDHAGRILGRVYSPFALQDRYMRTINQYMVRVGIHLSLVADPWTGLPIGMLPMVIED